MQALNIINILTRAFNKYTKVLLTSSYFCVHTSFNTPAKPMLFSNNMLKLSGLFFACNIIIFDRLDNIFSVGRGLA